MTAVLVAFDGSDQSKAALEYAFRTFPDADFTVLYTLDDDHSQPGLSNVKAMLKWLKSSEGRAELLYDTFMTATEKWDVSATAELVMDGLAKAVVKRAETGEFDQVVIGNYSRSERQLGRFTTVTERITRRVSLPVTAVRSLQNGQFATPPETVLVPMNGSEQGNKALDYACSNFPTADITALNVVEPLSVYFDDLDMEEWKTETIEEWETEIETHRSEIESLSQTLQNQSKSVLERATARAENQGIDLATVSVTGKPTETILSHVTDASIDLVCMGRHSRSRVEQFILGSVTESVLKNCPAPVTTLRERPDDELRERSN
ncbi:universal stress protein [Haloarcula marina]|uniref:universal stress protein n=1 Tax=Haloarcula marina TaxID=2961574 RepID=UPI0020B7BABE|nr:universal stress protein [Halomicroarcula marina]